MQKKTVFEVNPKKKGGESLMKKAIVAAMAVLFAVPAMAISIKDTPHNMSSRSAYQVRSTNESEICIFCHTPHNATQAVPLWNRVNPGGSFAMYTASPSFNAPKGALTVDSVSRMCMSCHDGTSGIGSGVVNQANGAIVMQGGVDTLNGRPSGLGTDLSNDHPINFSYNAAVMADPKVKAAALMDADLRFFKSQGGMFPKMAANDYLECATCHDVHGTANRAFLRKSNGSSNLCFTCHDK